MRAAALVVDPALRAVAPAWRRWRRLITHPEEFDESSAEEKIGKSYHDKVVRELKGKVGELEERLHEISVVSDVDAALIAEKALNRELQTANIGLREDVHTLRGQVLDLTKAPPPERARMVSELLARVEEFKQANREIRALREQLTRLHGASTDAQVAALKRGGLGAKTSMSKWGSIPPSLDEVKGVVPGGRPAPVPGPPAAGTDAKGIPRLRNRRPWTKAQCRLLSKDDARHIVLNEVRRLRQSFLDGQRDKSRLQSQLSEEASRNTQLTVALHALQERYMDKEHRMAQMQATIEELNTTA